MLHELRIENLLLIERAELRLGPGLNAITGETGAGKTILAHSFDLLLGGKARSGIVRPGDITRNNTISYEKIAEARVAYGGRGRLMEVQQPGWGHQVYDAITPF